MNRTAAALAIALTTLAGSAMAGTSWGAVPTTPSNVTRQEVMAQTAEAIKAGNIIAAGELGATVRAQNPGQFQADVSTTSTTSAMGAAAERQADTAMSHDSYAASRDTSRLY